MHSVHFNTRITMVEEILNFRAPTCSRKKDFEDDTNLFFCYPKSENPYLRTPSAAFSAKIFTVAGINTGSI